MSFLNLKEAAGLLHMSPEVLRRKVSSGEVPGAKPGKCWVFLEDDLVRYMRSQYQVQNNFYINQNNEGRSLCQTSTNAAVNIGSTSPARVAKEYEKALGLA